MSSKPKKRLKKKSMVCESHRAFVRKTILAAKEQIDKRGDPKLKPLRCTLLDKLSELNILDSEIIDLVDETKIEEDVTNSCDFASAIQACIVDLEKAIEGKYWKILERVRIYKERHWARKTLTRVFRREHNQTRQQFRPTQSCPNWN